VSEKNKKPAFTDSMTDNKGSGCSVTDNLVACMQMCKAAHHAGLPTAWVIFAIELCRRSPDKAQSWCILADAAAEDCQYKLAMTAYHLCWSMVQDAKVQKYCIQVRRTSSLSFCALQF